ncbi:efflux transporter outer membrane subunit [Massilia niastensis]|uniref:efflux transporter outer membrane subunit n=1 Tax=Massilia niastensis TaxID=544911 RepID=UPI00035D308C|nr:efflux transporter outer membrane subunit [Massilia niastensis]
MKAMFRVRAPAIAAAMLLSACAAPGFHQPEVAVPGRFRESQQPAAGAVHTAPDGTTWKLGRPVGEFARGEWWRVFGDARLDDLIEEADANNQDHAAAYARLRQARALFAAAQADRSPQLDLGAGAQRGRVPGQGGAPAPASSYTARLSASYEVDLFGRVSSNVAAARSDTLVSAASYRSLLLSLQADVAQAYFRLRSLDAELANLGQTVSLREETLKVTERRLALGDIGELDVERARTELAIARAEAIGLQRQRANSEHALAVLLGRPAPDFSFQADPLPAAGTLPQVPSGLPSALLERRPDVAAAQHAMRAANARIGVARAAMFPAISLNAGGGSVAGAASSLFSWSTRSWVLGALLQLPLLDGGRNRANVERSEAVLEEAVGSYRQRVLVAFAEVEDNLAGLRILGEQSVRIDEAVVSARRAASLAQKRYEAGRSGYLELLDAQRQLALAERSAVQLRGERVLATVALIRALGGDWREGGA